MKAFAAERASDGLGIELGNATCTHLLLGARCRVCCGM
jgi:hypothetical protein